MRITFREHLRIMFLKNTRLVLYRQYKGNKKFSKSQFYKGMMKKGDETTY